jgi:pimeloyl-ACP methyl ester carboxylesterase
LKTQEFQIMRRIVPVLALCACFLLAHCGPNKRHEDRSFDSNGVRIRYQINGQGPPVVLIHGFGETLERWHSAGVVSALSPHFQVITFDVRGHGRSDKPRDRQSYGTELAADIDRLLGHLSVPKAHIVGYSMGSLVALDFAILHQERALSVVLGGAGWNPPEALDEFSQQAEAFEQGRMQTRNADEAKALAALLRGLRGLSEQEVRRINVPMAAVIGSNDHFMPNVRRLARVLPSVKVVVINGADHATALSHPGFSSALLAFLRQPSAS